MPNSDIFIIAIDGPAASGKGSLGRAIAKHYKLAYLDTGLSYRALAFYALKANISADEGEKLAKIAYNLELDKLDSTALSQHVIGELASKIAVFPHLREILVAKQRAFAQKAQRAVLDGRDIASNVWPSAQIKFFITAALEVRAQRRYEQLLSQPLCSKSSQEREANISFAEILQDLTKRDERDKNRAINPLRASKDAHIIDTSSENIEQSLYKMRQIIDPVWQNYQFNKAKFIRNS